jgi:hypothetical protein
MSFPSAYVFLTIEQHRWQSPLGQTLAKSRMRKFAPSENKAARMDIERINQIGTRLADLTQRTEALRGYL